MESLFACMLKELKLTKRLISKDHLHERMMYPTRGGQVKFWRIYFFGQQGAKRRRSQSYGEHLQRCWVKKERDKNHLIIPRGV